MAHDASRYVWLPNVTLGELRGNEFLHLGDRFPLQVERPKKREVDSAVPSDPSFHGQILLPKDVNPNDVVGAEFVALTGAGVGRGHERGSRQKGEGDGCGDDVV